MKRQGFSLLIFALPLGACSGRFVDLELDQNGALASGGLALPSDTGGALGTGGAIVENVGGGGGLPHMHAGGGAHHTELTRGGFGAAMATVGEGKNDDGAFDEGCKGRGEPFFVYEADQCLAASACLEVCDPKSTAPSIITYRVKGGALHEATGECRASQDGKAEHEGLSFLVFPCDENAGCPPELVCADSDLGPACFVRDTPWVAGCTEAYCVRGDEPRPPAGERERCNEDVHCCAGFVCSDGFCESP